jgi:hypothetical protein
VKMTDKLRPGDSVRCEAGRTGVLNGIFAEVVAWVSWDDNRPGYESIENLSKVVRAATREIPSKPARRPGNEDVEDRTRYPRSQWPRAHEPIAA